MKIKNVKIHNILSIKDIDLDFGDSGLILVDGWNKDDNTANGAGKTAIFNALSYAIYSKFPRKVTISKFLRRGTKSGSVEATIEATNGDIWIVERQRPSGVKYYKNDQEQDITQSGFEDAIGLTYSQFLIVMYTAQTGGEKLISLNDSDTKDFFLQLMNLEKFNVHKKEVDAQTKVIKERIVEIEKLQVGMVSKIGVYEEYKTDISALREEIANLDYSDLTKQKLELSNVMRPNLSKYIDLESKIDIKIANVETHRRNDQIRLNRIASIDQLILDTTNSALKCPNCSADVVKKGTIVHHLPDFIAQKIEEKTALELAKPDENEDKSKELLKLRSALNDKRTKDLSDFTKATSRITDLDRVISTRQAKIEQCEAKILRGIDSEKKIQEIEVVLSKANKTLATKNTELELLQTVANILSPTGAPAYIMDSLVDIFNNKMSAYVSMVWPNATYNIQTFKTNKTGDVKAKFSENLVIAGYETEIGGLSGGEHKCLSLAMDFAVVDLLEAMFSIQVNPIILDEPFDGLDSSNRERVIELLEEIAVNRQVIVIDHASETRASFSEIIRVEKSNGISSLV